MKLHFPGRAAKALRIIFLLILSLVCLYSLFIAFSHVFIGDQEVFLFTPTFATSGSPFPLRVVVRNHSDNLPVENATVTAYFLGPKQTRYPIFRGKTDIHGFATATLTTPGDIKDLEMELRLSVRSPRGWDVMVKKIPLKYPDRIILSSDKSTYRSGETIYMAVKAKGREELPRPSPLPVKLSVDDSRGTTIFRSEGATSAYGIFSSACVLADPINTGIYKIKAETPDAYLEKNILVAGNARPAFTLDVRTEKDYIVPGDEVRGSVSAIIPPGEPVRRGAVTLLFSLSTGKKTEILSRANGEMGSSGTFPFHFEAPVHLPPSMSWGENPKALIDISVIDSGSQKENMVRELPFSEKSLIMSWIPEGRGFVPGLPNHSYLIAAYPDGKAASANLLVKTRDRTLSLMTDRWGMAELPFDPQKDGTNLKISAKIPHSQSPEVVTELSSPISPAAFMLKTDKVLYHQGDRVSVSLDSHERRTFVFLDLLVNGQIPLSNIINVQDGKAREEIALPDNVAGPAQLLATRISSDGDFEQEWQNILIMPRNALHIKIMPSKKAFSPREIGTINFQCRELPDHAAKCALSVSIIEARDRHVEKGDPFSGKDSPFGSYLSQSSIRIPPTVINDVASAIESTTVGSNDASTQRLAKIAFSPLILPRQEIYATDLYAQNLKYNQERRKRYFSSLLIYLFRGLLLFITGCFLVILGLTLTHTYLKGKDERRVLLLRNNDDVMSLLIFIIGFLLLLLGPMIFFLPIFLFAPVGVEEIQGHPFFPLFLALELFLMFIYLVALWRNVRVRPIRKMLTLRSTFITLQYYVGALIAFLSLLFTNSLTKWNMEQVLMANIPYMLLALFTLCSMPFLLVYSTLSHVMTPRKSVFRTLTFYVSSAIIICALVASSILIFHYSSRLQKAALPAEKESAHQSQSMDESLKIMRDQPGNSAGEETALKVPETLLYVPQLLTDDKGDARLLLQMTDLLSPFSIEAIGYGANGAEGHSVSRINVRSDLQLKADFPSSLTSGDVVSLPVNLTSNSSKTLALKLRMSSTNTKNSAPLAATLAPLENRTIYLPFRAKEPGMQKLAVFAKSAHDSSTTCREIEVLPEGEITSFSRSGWLNEAVNLPFTKAAKTSLPYGAELHLYPSLPSLLLALSGTLESLPCVHINEVLTFSYPDVLLLKYYRESSLNDSEELKKAATHVGSGYQRLLHFESPGGGFSAFGDRKSDLSPACPPPAPRQPHGSNAEGDLWLSACALQGLADMAEVYPVDRKVLERTSRWLQNKQKQDGSWENSRHTTAYVLLSLINGGCADSSKIEKGLDYLGKSIRKDADSETLGLFALALMKSHKDAAQLLERIQKTAQSSGSGSYWASGIQAPFRISSREGDIQTTAICARALLLSGQYQELKGKALNYLMGSRDPGGSWHGPPTTYEALKTIMDAETSSRKEQKGSVKISMGDISVQNPMINPDKDLKAIDIDLSPYLTHGADELNLTVDGSLRCAYELIITHEPSGKGHAAKKGLSLGITYEKKTLPVNGKLKELVSITNGSERDAGLSVVELPIPPGFDPVMQDLQDLKIIDAFGIKGNRIYLYIAGVKKDAALTFSMTFRARYPAMAVAPGACIYEYYDRLERSYARGAHLTVLP
jgi:hypothetical protein